MKRTSTKAATIPSSRWMAYAIAGLATGPSVAQSVEAEIHYSGKVHVRLDQRTSSHFLPLSGSASLVIFRGSSFEGQYEELWLRAKSSGAVLINSSLDFHAQVF